MEVHRLSQVGGIDVNFRVVTGSTVATQTDYIIACNHGLLLGITVTLPNANLRSGQLIIIKRWGSGDTAAITVNSGGGTLQSRTGTTVTSYNLPLTFEQYGCWFSDGTNWKYLGD